jgi:hypothetical protein
MNPSTAIAPRTLVRRLNAKRWHIAEVVPMGAPSRGFCGVVIRVAVPSMQAKVAYNANEITCTACIVEAISRHR